jgi:hypothetical protein
MSYEKFCRLFAYDLEHFGMPKYYLRCGLKFDRLPINLLTGNSRDSLASTIDYRNLIAQCSYVFVPVRYI